MNTESRDRLKEISFEVNEHIIAVRGTLELLDASVEEDDLRNLLLKAVERMDTLQRLSNEIFAVLQMIFDKMDRPEK
ncbi:MAG: hypothetical protein IBX72_00240 [Nitrospirae bacterium]|jgi:hypothetical protein|nr:hypothetical protein [Nitrospirota bacterium]